MPDFEATLSRNIARGTALCTRDAHANVLGGVLIPLSPHSQISWSAVRRSARGRGIGRTLVAEVLHRYSSSPEVIVDTFGEDNV
jgi:ribosomal protein S18 acetylase RimI-like enzyme